MWDVCYGKAAVVNTMTISTNQQLVSEHQMKMLSLSCDEHFL